MITTTNNLPFELRLKMASAVIDAQLRRAKPANRQAVMNGLWARWINSNVLGNRPSAPEVQP